MQPISKSSASKHIARLLSRWPTDPVRPSSVSVQTYLQSRVDPPPPPPSQSSSSSLLSSLFSSKKSTPRQPDSSTAKEPPLLSQKSINALYSLLENRYQDAHPLPRSLRRPASRPEHYDLLLKEFEEAPSRNWFGRVKKRLGGAFRMK